MNARYQITVGIEFDKNGQAIQPALSLREFGRMLVNWFGGYTRIENFGGWADGSGKLVEEKSVTYQIDTEDSYTRDGLINGAAEWIATRLNQSAVLVTKQSVVSISFVNSRAA